MKKIKLMKSIIGKPNSKGYTLIEGVAAGMLLIICAAILATGFLSSLSMIRKGMDITKKSLRTSSIVEGAEFTEAEITKSVSAGSLVYSVGGKIYAISGSYTYAYYAEDRIGFSVFAAG